MPDLEPWEQQRAPSLEPDQRIYAAAAIRDGEDGDAKVVIVVRVGWEL